MITYETLNCNGRLIELHTPKVMGVLNINMDSFYAESRVKSIDALLEKGNTMSSQGVQFFDIGAMSSRPGAALISAEEELTRLKDPFIELVKAFPEIPISVDTIHSEVAAWALAQGAGMINDISGGRYDANMFTVVGEHAAPFVMMHMQGLPDTMQMHPQYENVVLEIFDFFTERLEAAQKANILDIILDPGIGFGKTIQHNFSLIHYLDAFEVLRYPILIGVSRKSFIRKVLDVDIAGALNGSTAVHMVALMKGAKIIRAHDVKEAVQCIKIWKEFQRKDVVEMEF